ncbi:ADP-ribosyltransferase [Vibrio campbellii]|uniref:ADP-ribosyltransferase n=1 Tax=Vibrio campbellii TaxID=680 RepID=UPI00215C83B2|nr:ADP-ribosyltransferase [Vibrio campbellii]MCR9907468.1 ADP-ribosyltransferase [Vibrio campbellii]
MKTRKLLFGLLIQVILCSHSMAGLKYNDKYYSSSDIEEIMEIMSEPGIDDYGEFNRLREELYEQADVQKGLLSEEQAAALAEYQDYAFASTRESFISGVFDDETLNIIDHIDSAFESGAKYQGVTFRGERELGAYMSDIQVGDIVSPSAYVSTSISKDAAYNFHSGQLARFELQHGKSGIVIPSVIDGELEVLINRNSYFEVTAIKTSYMGTHVVYREIDPNSVGNKKIKDMHSGEEITAAEVCAF